MGGGIWETSGPTFTLVLPTHPPEQSLTPLPTSHPSLRSSFSHILLGSKIYLLYL